MRRDQLEHAIRTACQIIERIGVRRAGVQAPGSGSSGQVTGTGGRCRPAMSGRAPGSHGG